LLVNGSGNADLSGLGELLQTCRDVDPIPIEIAVAHDHVAKVDADAKDHPAISGKIGVAPLEGALHGDGTADRLNRTGELRHNGVARHAENPPLVLCNQIGDDFLIKCQCFECAFFIRGHEPAISSHISGEDDRKSPIDLG
jgi:hypothetical protein